MPSRPTLRSWTTTRRRKEARDARSPDLDALRASGVSMLEYKVVETSDVSAEALEAILNEWTRAGWTLDTMQFAMRDSSKRPAMAFVTFTKPAEDGA